MKKNKRNLNEVVHYSFMVKTYYRDVQAGYPSEHEVIGDKTIKLFLSWFRLMLSRNRLLYGFVDFNDGETWIWQPQNKYGRGGWQKCRSSQQ